MFISVRSAHSSWAHPSQSKHWIQVSVRDSAYFATNQTKCVRRFLCIVEGFFTLLLRKISPAWLWKVTFRLPFLLALTCKAKLSEFEIFWHFLFLMVYVEYAAVVNGKMLFGEMKTSVFFGGCGGVLFDSDQVLIVSGLNHVMNLSWSKI